MSFAKAITQLLAHEGGFVNHPADKGGPTNLGITQSVYEAFKNRKVTLDEMKRMPRSDAEAIYKTNYWDKVLGDQIKSYPMAYALFDQAVNGGVSTAVARAQKILGVTADGRMGPATLAALNAYGESPFISNFISASKANYEKIVAKNPSQSVFLKGWLNRISSLESYSLSNLGISNQAALTAVAVLALGGILLLTVGTKTRA